MIEWIGESLGPWAWMILGVLLLGLEILAPGTFFLWFGISAVIVGILSFLIDWSWQMQIIAFIVIAAICLVFGRRFFRRRHGADDVEGETLNQRAARYIGRTFVLSEPIVEGDGRLKIDDTIWRVSGPDSPAGTRVTVESSKGARLLVTPAED